MRHIKPHPPSRPLKVKKNPQIVVSIYIYHAEFLFSVPTFRTFSQIRLRLNQRRSVPFSPLLLSTYCISELLRIYLAPPVFDYSANNGGMQRHVCPLTSFCTVFHTTYEHAKLVVGRSDNGIVLFRTLANLLMENVIYSDLTA